jgi:signal transduction histidine kinase
MIKCSHANDKCPISKSTCPGICIYSIILENINIGIVVFDIERKEIVFRNQLFLNIFGSEAGEPGYAAIYELLMPKGEAFPSEPSPFFAPPLRHNGRIFGYTIYGIIEKFMWIFIRDITDKIKLEALAEAVNITTNIGYVFSGVRHEIGNPINSIKNAISVLRANIDNYSKEKIMSYLDRTLDDVGRVEYLLKSLKNFNMFENPKLESIDTELFMKRFLSLVGKDFEAGGINIRYVVYPGAEWCYSDPRALQQVFLNLVTNAADALEGREDPYILITIFRDRGDIQVVIEDNGCGMSEENQKEMFKPFFTSKQKGTGLGLIITKKMLANMKSTIFIESYKNMGTIVHISIPEVRIAP